MEEVEGCDGRGIEVVVVSGSKCGTNREIEEKEGKEEKEDEGVGVKFEMEGEIWVVNEKKWE